MKDSQGSGIRNTVAIALAVLLGAGLACGKAGEKQAGRGGEPVKAELRLPVATELQGVEEARQLFADGKPVAAELSAGTLSYRFDAPAAGGGPMPQFEAMMPGLCGWSRQTLQLSEPDAAVIARARSAGKPVVIHASWKPEAKPSTIRLFVDNRAGPARQLIYYIRPPFVRSVAIPADSLYRTEVESPSCPGTLQFTLDGKEIEPLPTPPPKTPAPWAWWLDPSAKRCYREEKIAYTKFADSFTQGAILSTQSAGHWHPMSVEDDYILESAPQKITVSDDQIDTLKKTRWSEERCP